MTPETIPPPPSGDIVMPDNIPAPPSGEIVMPAEDKDFESTIVGEAEPKKEGETQGVDDGSYKPIPPKDKSAEQKFVENLPPVTLGEDSRRVQPSDNIAKPNLQAKDDERQSKQVIAVREADAVETIDAELRAYHKDGNFAYMDKAEKDALKEVIRRRFKKADVDYDKAFDAAFQMRTDQYAKTRNNSIYDINIEAEKLKSPNKSTAAVMKEFDERKIDEIANSSLTPNQREILNLTEQQSELRAFLGGSYIPKPDGAPRSEEDKKIEANANNYLKSPTYQELTKRIEELRGGEDLYSTITGELKRRDPKLASLEGEVKKKAETYAKTYKDNVGNALVKTDLALKQLDEMLAGSSRVQTDNTGRTYSYGDLASGGSLDHYFATGENAKEGSKANKLKKERDDIYMEREALKNGLRITRNLLLPRVLNRHRKRLGLKRTSRWTMLLKTICLKVLDREPVKVLSCCRIF